MKSTIDMAREAGLSPVDYPTTEKLKAFEAIVRADERNRTWTQEHWTDYERSIAAAEREACAKVCESTAPSQINGYECADLIRNRGNT
jgi:hypothetical protein